jgi:putative NADPH-quinone reductase
MRCLVVHAHPDPDSYSAALRQRVVSGLTTAGHDVELIDLYALHAQGYDPCLNEAEHVDYLTIGDDHPDPMVAGHIEQLRWAEALIFVYPTWWAGLPAILKGWLDRTFLPGVSFTLSGPAGKETVRPGLTNVGHVVGVTTYGSGRLEVALLGDAGRRTITRSVRLVCGRRCRTSWFGLNRLDTADDRARADFLDRVEAGLGNLAVGR